MEANVINQTQAWSTSGAITAAAAVVAIVLSQLPPIRSLLRGRRLEAVAAESVVITHYLGNVHFVTFLSMVNTGGMALAIARVACRLTGPDGMVRELPAQAYISREVPAQVGQPSPEYPLGWIALRPGEQWSQTVRFYQAWSTSDERESAELSQSIREDIHSIIDELGSSYDPRTYVEADRARVQQARDFFERHFDLSAGVHRLEVTASDAKGRLLASREYEFTLHESALSALRRGVDDYRFGEGVYFPATKPSSVAWVRLRESGTGG